MSFWRAAAGLPVLNLGQVVRVDRTGSDKYVVNLTANVTIRLDERDGASLVVAMAGEPLGDLARALARIPPGFHVRVGRELDDGREFYTALLLREAPAGPDELLWSTQESASDWPTFERLLAEGLATPGLFARGPVP